MDEIVFQDKMTRLIDLLYSRTIESRINWERLDRTKYKHLILNPTYIVNEGYVTQLKGKFIAVGSINRTNESLEYNANQNYYISFLDESYKAVDSYLDYEIAYGFEEPKLQNLVKAARRYIFNIDDFLNSVLD